MKLRKTTSFFGGDDCWMFEVRESASISSKLFSKMVFIRAVSRGLQIYHVT